MQSQTLDPSSSSTLPSQSRKPKKPNGDTTSVNVSPRTADPVQNVPDTVQDTEPSQGDVNMPQVDPPDPATSSSGLGPSSRKEKDGGGEPQSAFNFMDVVMN